MARAMAAEETVDSAVHFLHKLQSEGWAVQSVACQFDHASVSKRRIPVEAVLTVRLIPAR